MKKLVIYFVCIFSCITFYSCDEKNIMMYENEPRVYFEIPGTGSIAIRDSLMFSFPAYPTLGGDTTLHFKARIMGNAADFDRRVDVEIDPSSTAVEGVNFKFQSTSVPASAFEVMIPVTVYREGLSTQSVRLELNVKENDFFKIGYSKKTKVVLVWGDFYLKPDIWDSSNYKNAFGTFSQIRYEFILKACGISELPDPMNIITMGYCNVLVRSKLDEYNKMPGNEPLTDENGVVQFPVWTGQGGVG